MIRRPPRTTRTDTLFPYTTLFRSSVLPGVHRDGNRSPRYSWTANRLVRTIPMPGQRCDPGLPCLDRRYCSPVHRAWSVALRGVFSGYRSEEHTSELQSLMRISYAVFCLKKKNTTNTHKRKLIQ